MSDNVSPSAAQATLAAGDCPAVILAGGRSSRFGSDKALVEVENQPLLLVLRDSLQRQGHAVSIVADRADRYQALGLQCLVDHTPHSGPLAGLATALQQRLLRGPGWLLLMSCDQIVWHEAWFNQLAHAATGPQGQLDCEVAYFVSCDASETRRIEPLPSLLHTRLLSEVFARLQRRELSLQKLFEGCRACGVETETSPKVWSFNTPEELRTLGYKGLHTWGGA